MKYPDPADIYYGKGPLAAAALAADTHQGMSAYENTLMRNNAIPENIFVTEQNLTDAQITRFKDEWNAKHRGPRNAGKTAILQGGLDIKNIALTPRELGFLQGRKVPRPEIEAIFGVPMSLLTVEDVKSAPATGMIVGNVSYARRTIRPRCRRIEEKLNEQLLPLYDPKLFVAFDNPVPEDKRAAAEEREINLRTGYTTINEERLEDNRKPVEWGDTPIMPMNLVPLGTQSFSPSLSGGDRTGLEAGPTLRFIDPDDLPPPRDSLAAILRQVFQQQKAEVLGSMPKAVIQAKAKVPKVNVDKWNKELVKRSKADMKKLLAAGGKRGMQQLGLGLSFDINTPEAQAFVKKHSFKFAQAVNKETNAKLQLHFAQGLEAGETMIELRKRIEEKVFGPEITRNRADMIARTESARAMMAGTEQAWGDSEVVVAKEWNGAADMCEFCQAMNAQFGPGTGGVSLGSTFVDQGETVTGVDGGKLGTDYGPINYPPIHPNCRCDLLPVIKET